MRGRRGRREGRGGRRGRRARAPERASDAGGPSRRRRRGRGRNDGDRAERRRRRDGRFRALVLRRPCPPRLRLRLRLCPRRPERHRLHPHPRRRRRRRRRRRLDRARQPRADGVRVALRALDRVGERLGQVRQLLRALGEGESEEGEGGGKAGRTSGSLRRARSLRAAHRGTNASAATPMSSTSPATNPSASSGRSYGLMSGRSTLSYTKSEPCVRALAPVSSARARTVERGRGKRTHRAAPAQDGDEDEALERAVQRDDPRDRLVGRRLEQEDAHLRAPGPARQLAALRTGRGGRRESDARGRPSWPPRPAPPCASRARCATRARAHRSELRRARRAGRGAAP